MIALFFINTSALKKILTDIERLEAALESGHSAEDMLIVPPCAGAGARKCVPCREAPNAVLVALGTRGQLRALWEYYKTYSDKTPVYGQAAALSNKVGSYISELHTALQEALKPEIVEKTAEMR